MDKYERQLFRLVKISHDKRKLNHFLCRSFNKSIKCKSQLSFSKFVKTNMTFLKCNSTFFFLVQSIFIQTYILNNIFCFGFECMTTIKMTTCKLASPGEDACGASSTCSFQVYSRSWCLRLWQPCKVSLTEAVSFCLGHSSSKAGAGRDLAKREWGRKKLVRKEKHRNKPGANWIIWEFTPLKFSGFERWGQWNAWQSRLAYVCTNSPIKCIKYSCIGTRTCLSATSAMSCWAGHHHVPPVEPDTPMVPLFTDQTSANKSTQTLAHA